MVIVFVIWDSSLYCSVYCLTIHDSLLYCILHKAARDTGSMQHNFLRQLYEERTSKKFLLLLLPFCLNFTLDGRNALYVRAILKANRNTIETMPSPLYQKSLPSLRVKKELFFFYHYYYFTLSISSALD